MNQVTLKVNGMRCGMCEAHICDVIRKEVPDAKSVKASHSKKTASFRTEGPVDEERLTAAINETGYSCESVSIEPCETRGFRFFQ